MYTPVLASASLSASATRLSTLVADHCISRLMCDMLAVGMWHWAMLPTWACELPPARLCAASGRPCWGFMCSVTAYIGNEYAAAYRR